MPLSPSLPPGKHAQFVRHGCRVFRARGSKFEEGGSRGGDTLLDEKDNELHINKQNDKLVFAN